MEIFADAGMAAILLTYFITGLRRGFIRSLADLIGGIVALVGAVLCAGRFAVWAQTLFGSAAPKWMRDPIISKIVAVLVLFVVFEVLIQTAASMLSHVCRLPGLRQLNALLGGALGLCKGAVVVLLLCASLRMSLPTAAVDGLAATQGLRQAAFSQIYKAVSGYNPVYKLFQSDLWNGVGSNGTKESKQEL